MNTSRPPDVLSEEVEALLADWDELDRVLFEELVVGASSELQRELLHRAVAARHPVAEVHAFADQIRGLSDRELYDACTPPSTHQGKPLPVTQRLQAEADPLFAFQLSRPPPARRVSLGDEADQPTDYGPPSLHGMRPAQRRPYLPTGAEAGFPDETTVDPLHRPRGQVRVRFDEDAAEAADHTAPIELAPSWADLGELPVPAQPWAEDLLNNIGRALGVTFREVEIDGRRLSPEAAWAFAAESLQRGLPVPVLLQERRTGETRGALLLQLWDEGSGKRHFQLHDPVGQETVWVSERSLVAGTALPLRQAPSYRLSRICLPEGPPTTSPLTRKGAS